MSITAANWGDLSRLLDQALDLEPEKRSQWLDTLAPQYEHLKGTLADLLADSGGVETDDLLNRIPKYVEASLAKPAADEHVGPYRLIRELGTGGMAAVWLAERADGAMQRQVALKLPRVASVDRGLIDRMRRERDILASLEHPNIARLYDAGADANGRPYLALEYVDGVPLDVYGRERPLTLRQRLDLFLKIARAVAFAHARLIVHRDLKPTNILVKGDGDVRLLDFGIARLLQNELEQGAQHTQFGGRALTPRYAAPEQFSGQSITVATDVYSLGVVLYELLTGTSPYAPKRDSDAALEESVLHDAPSLPSKAAQPAASRALRGDLDGILIKALKKAPLDRYASVEAFAADIECYLHGRPISARPTSSWYQFNKFVSRHALQVSAAAVALLAILGGATVAIWQAREAAAERDHAFALASRNKAINDFTEMLITEAAASEKPVTITELLARSEKLALADTSGVPENRAAVLAMIAGRYLTLGDFGKAASLFERALALVRNSQDGSMRSRLVCDHALASFVLKQSDSAVRAITDEVEHLKSDPEVASNCLLDRALIGVMVGDAEDVLRYATLALDRAHQVSRTTMVDEGVILGTVADGHRMNGHIEAANRYFELALQKLAGVGRERGPDASNIRGNWAMVSSWVGVPKRAVEIYDRTLAMVAESDGGGHPPALVVYNRARALEFIGRFAEARDGYEVCRRLGRESKNFDAEYYCLLGSASVAEEFGDRALAARYLKEVSELPGVVALPPGSPLLANLEFGHAVLDLGNGRLDDARKRFEQVIGKKRNNPTTVRALMGKADAELRSNDTAASLSDAQAALAMAKSLQGSAPYSNRTGLAWLLLGRVLLTRGETVEARKALDAAVNNLSNTVDADHPELVRAKKLLGENG